MGWADLDKLAVARPRPDGRATLIAVDDRTTDAIAEARALSTLVAICRVTRGRQVIADRHEGRGVVVYSTREAPPDFIVEAVTAAGGVVFDGTREHTATAPRATTVLLDEAFFDLATRVRRRLGARGFAGTLEVLEDEIRRCPLIEPTARWTAILELAAVAGELARADGGGTWVTAPTEALPVALTRGARGTLRPYTAAALLVDRSEGSLAPLVVPPVATASAVTHATASSRAMPLLCARAAVPLDSLTWLPLLPAEADTADLPVIVFVEDRDDAIGYPQNQGAPTEALRREALANLAANAFEITTVPVSGGPLVVVTGGFYGAEALLDHATMERVRSELGGPGLMAVAAPARGQLLALDGDRLALDGELAAIFIQAVASEYERASERDRISKVVIAYGERPDGRLVVSE